MVFLFVDTDFAAVASQVTKKRAHLSVPNKDNASPLQSLEGDLEALLGTVKSGFHQRDKALKSTMALLAERDNQNAELRSQISGEKEKILQSLIEKDRQFKELEKKYTSEQRQWIKREKSLNEEISRLKQQLDQETEHMNALLKRKESANLAQNEQIKSLESRIEQYKQLNESLKTQYQSAQKQLEEKNKEISGLRIREKGLREEMNDEGGQIPLLQHEIEILKERLKAKEKEALEKEMLLERERDEKDNIIREKHISEQKMEEAKQQAERLNILVSFIKRSQL